MKFFKHYQEILFGLGLGAAMWVLDAAMHAQLGGEIHSHGFLAEMFQPGPTQLLFRGFYVVLATAFGWYLWRANWRERELRALENAITAFHRQLDSPALRIASQSRILQGRQSVALDAIALSSAQAIAADAHLIDELAQQYLNFSAQVRAGRIPEAVATLQAIEHWTPQDWQHGAR